MKVKLDNYNKMGIFNLESLVKDQLRPNVEGGVNEFKDQLDRISDMLAELINGLAEARTLPHETIENIIMLNFEEVEKE